jgi:thiol:disulfide interchange protein
VPKRQPHKASKLPQILAIAGLVIVVLAIFLIKGKLQVAQPTVDPNASAEVQLDQALANHRPTLAFYHSNNCKQCLIMIDTVNQVYPDFSTSVALIDINVYDSNNRSLLQRVGLQFIPTIIFYDRAGQAETRAGVMEAEELHQTLSVLAQGD